MSMDWNISWILLFSRRGVVLTGGHYYFWSSGSVQAAVGGPQHQEGWFIWAIPNLYENKLRLQIWLWKELSPSLTLWLVLAQGLRSPNDSHIPWTRNFNYLPIKARVSAISHFTSISQVYRPILFTDQHHTASVELPWNEVTTIQQMTSAPHSVPRAECPSPTSSLRQQFLAWASLWCPWQPHLLMLKCHCRVFCLFCFSWSLFDMNLCWIHSQNFPA